MSCHVSAWCCVSQLLLSVLLNFLKRVLESLLIINWMCIFVRVVRL